MSSCHHEAPWRGAVGTRSSPRATPSRRAGAPDLIVDRWPPLRASARRRQLSLMAGMKRTFCASSRLWLHSA
jgi:hypothetical protein